MLDRMIQEIENKYNADNDIVPGQPMVSWTENQLLQMIKIVDEKIDIKVQDLREAHSEALHEYNELDEYCDALKQLLREAVNALNPANTEPVDIVSLISRIEIELR